MYSIFCTCGVACACIKIFCKNPSHARPFASIKLKQKQKLSTKQKLFLAISRCGNVRHKSERINTFEQKTILLQTKISYNTLRAIERATCKFVANIFGKSFGFALFSLLSLNLKTKLENEFFWTILV